MIERRTTKVSDNYLDLSNIPCCVIGLIFFSVSALGLAVSERIFRGVAATCTSY